MLKVRGFTLVELIVAMAIGSVIALSLSQVFATSTRVKAENDRLGLQIENGRFAMDMLKGELAHAAFWGGLDQSTALSYYRTWSLRPATLPSPCETNVANLMDALPYHVQGYNLEPGDALPAELNCLSDHKDGTDVLVVRRAGTCAVGDANCEPNELADTAYFQASYCSPDDGTELGKTLTAGTEWPDLKSNWFIVSSNAGALTLHDFMPANTVACKTGGFAPRRPYIVKIFYVSNNTTGSDGIPALRVAQLESGPAFAQGSQVLVSGIEQLHFEYGGPFQGAPSDGDIAVDPGAYNACGGVTCLNNWLSVNRVRIHLLSRGATKSPDYVNKQIYTLGLNTDGTANTYPAFNDHYRRQYFTQTVRLVNAAN